MSQPSLDAIALLLMQLDPPDDAGASRLASALRDAAEAATELDPASRTAVAQCAAAVDAAAPAERGAVLVAAGHLLEAWMQERPLAWLPAGGATGADAATALPPEDVVTDDLTPRPLPDDVDLDLMRDFITESREMLAGAEAALLQLETDPSNDEAVNTVFRAFHTVKGTSAFLSLDALSHFAHKAESVLSQVRDRTLPYNAVTAELSLQSADLLREFFDAVEAAMDGSPLVVPASLPQLARDLEAAAAGTLPALAVEAPPLPSPRLGDILVERGVLDRDTLEAVHAEEPTVPLGEALVSAHAAPLAEVARALRQQSQQQKPWRQEAASAADSIRVRTDRLDRLIDMVGELVIAQAMISADDTMAQGAQQGLSRKVSMAGKIVRDLQDLSMSMRMVPLKPVFQKLARLVRDLGQKNGKTVVFETHGEDTELDRNMVDAIADPLVHMVRNSLDHGLEMPADRAAAGKAETGLLRLSAYHAGGAVVVELHDDGRGLQRERILAKAMARGMVDGSKALSDQDVFALIFAPGFSTADKVTDVSGRGVGMDVVRRNIESIRGRIEIASTPGVGTTFTMRLPLTLAITDGMLVRVGSERYIVPTTSIQLSFRPTAEQICTVAGRGELVVLRDETLPIVRLHRLFEVPGAHERISESLLMLVGEGDRRVALMVDDLLGQQQVVAKSLGEGMGMVAGLSGGAILGDGRVGLILDIAQVVELSRRASGDAEDGSATARAAA
jgi:two-component system chemotaxis sensor kinase CheA